MWQEEQFKYPWTELAQSWKHDWKLIRHPKSVECGEGHFILHGCSQINAVALRSDHSAIDAGPWRADWVIPVGGITAQGELVAGFTGESAVPPANQVEQSSLFSINDPRRKSTIEFVANHQRCESSKHRPSRHWQAISELRHCCWVAAPIQPAIWVELMLEFGELVKVPVFAAGVTHFFLSLFFSFYFLKSLIFEFDNFKSKKPSIYSRKNSSARKKTPSSENAPILLLVTTFWQQFQFITFQILEISISIFICGGGMHG